MWLCTFLAAWFTVCAHAIRFSIDHLTQTQTHTHTRPPKTPHTATLFNGYRRSESMEGAWSTLQYVRFSPMNSRTLTKKLKQKAWTKKNYRAHPIHTKLACNYHPFNWLDRLFVLYRLFLSRVHRSAIYQLQFEQNTVNTKRLKTE